MKPHPIDRHVFLVGFMGAGKTTVARLLAAQLGLPAIDLDDRIVEAAGAPVAEIFAREGEESFRDMESEALLELAEREPSVVACGGGVVLRSGNRATLKELGIVVYLVVTAGEALARIGDADTRPLLAGASGTLAATSLLGAREALYRSVADITVDTVGSDPSHLALDVAEQIRGIAS